MSQDRLNIKHIAPYLPHKLKYINRHSKNEHYKLDRVEKIGNRLKYDEPVLYGFTDGYKNALMCCMSNVKLFLRPLSDLYKEINGEVGINVIGKMFEPNGVLNFEDGNYYYGWNTHVCDDYQGYEIGWIEKTGWFGIFFDTYDYENQSENFTGDYLPYNRKIADYLDSRHYDWRYNLIEQGLAINKNDIE